MAESSATDSSDSNGHETCFLDLSAELRNEIYELALFPQDESPSPPAACQINYADATKPMVPEPGLLRSCRQARADASPMFYGRTSFQIPLIHLTRFINITKPENLAAIQELRIHDYISQCKDNMVGVCKAIKAIQGSKLRMATVKVCMAPPLERWSGRYNKRDRLDHKCFGIPCEWKSLVELEDYYLSYNGKGIVRTDSVEERYEGVLAIAPKQLQGVIERVKLEKSQDDELTESLRYLARHWKNVEPSAREKGEVPKRKKSGLAKIGWQWDGSLN